MPEITKCYKIASYRTVGTICFHFSKRMKGDKNYEINTIHSSIYVVMEEFDPFLTLICDIRPETSHGTNGRRF